MKIERERHSCLAVVRVRQDHHRSGRHARIHVHGFLRDRRHHVLRGGAGACSHHATLAAEACDAASAAVRRGAEVGLAAVRRVHVAVREAGHAVEGARVVDPAAGHRRVRGRGAGLAARAEAVCVADRSRGLARGARRGARHAHEPLARVALTHLTGGAVRVHDAADALAPGGIAHGRGPGAVARRSTRARRWHARVRAADLAAGAVPVGVAIDAVAQRRAAHLPRAHPRRGASRDYGAAVGEAHLPRRAIGRRVALHAAARRGVAHLPSRAAIPVRDAWHGRDVRAIGDVARRVGAGVRWWGYGRARATQ